MKKFPDKLHFLRLLDFRGLTLFLKKENFSNMVLIFMIIIFLPLIDDVFHFSSRIESYRVKENRIRTPRPKFEIGSIFPYLNKYRKYYEDNFNFRDSLIYGSNLINMTLFNESFVNRVLIGRDKWLFLARESGYSMIDYYRNTREFSTGELTLWAKRLRQRQNWAAAHGCTYIFMIAPAKTSIYPEMVPGSIRKYRKRSRFDQLVDFLSKENDLNFVDLRAPLMRLKRRWRIYRRTDTHWNDIGAYAAYQEIMNRIKAIYPRATRASMDEFRILPEHGRGGDLAAMLSLETSLFTDEVIYLRPKNNRVARMEDQSLISEGFELREYVNPKGELPPLLFVHDSFGLFLHHYLAEHFSKMYCIQDKNLTFYSHFIKEKKVKIIIDEMAERFLLYKQPPPVQ
jgi:alginate O-acetyltransferase complex protein AlgJ